MKREMWVDLQTCLSMIRTVEFLLGYLPEKPRVLVEHDLIQTQLMDARMLLGKVGLALSEAENA